MAGGSAPPAIASALDSDTLTLASGEADVDTGVASTTQATFLVAVGCDTDDARVAAEVVAVSGGNHTVTFKETSTSVGNPTIWYDIYRVR